MHWILTVAETFSLAQVIRRSQWLLCPPFGVNRSQDMLYRVELLSNGHTVAYTVAHAPAGLLIETQERLSGSETEEISHKTWRMLRLGENLQPFLELARHTPELAVTLRDGARLLRGATLFEDVIRALVWGLAAEAQRVFWMTMLVERLGDPLPSNPTRHAFPTPHHVLRDKHILHQAFETPLSQQVTRIAALFADGGEPLERLAQAELPLSLLEHTLRQRLELPESVLGLVMLSLGRYDYLPTDEAARRRVAARFYQREMITAAEMLEAFAPLHPWGGLAYWLWNWPTSPQPLEALQGESNGTLGTRCGAI